MTTRDVKDRLLRWMSIFTSLPIARHLLRAAIQARLVPYAVWSRLPVVATFPLQFEGREFLYECTAEDFVGRSLFWKGVAGYEPETTTVFSRLAATSTMIVDVGAHSGLYSLIACAANPASSVTAFEPVPYIAERLRSQVALNGFEDRCDAHVLAVSDRDAMIELHVPLGVMPRSASLHPDGFRHSAGVLVQTRAVTIDTFLPARSTVDLVKIDVEGFEDTVLEGMSELLATSRPTIVFEVLPDGPVTAVSSILRRHSYRIFQLTGDGPVEVEAIVADATDRDRNFVAVDRADHIELLQRLRIGAG